MKKLLCSCVDSCLAVSQTEAAGLDSHPATELPRCILYPYGKVIQRQSYITISVSIVLYCYPGRGGRGGFAPRGRGGVDKRGGGRGGRGGRGAGRGGGRGGAKVRLLSFIPPATSKRLLVCTIPLRTLTLSSVGYERRSLQHV